MMMPKVIIFTMKIMVPYCDDNNKTIIMMMIMMMMMI